MKRLLSLASAVVILTLMAQEAQAQVLSGGTMSAAGTTPICSDCVDDFEGPSGVTHVVYYTGSPWGGDVACSVGGCHWSIRYPDACLTHHDWCMYGSNKTLRRVQDAIKTRDLNGFEEILAADGGAHVALNLASGTVSVSGCTGKTLARLALPESFAAWAYAVAPTEARAGEDTAE
ncbi:MAG: hypothetical protein ACE5FJ_06175 [Gemmatimonadales bacterium]